MPQTEHFLPVRTCAASDCIKAVGGSWPPPQSLWSVLLGVLSHPPFLLEPSRPRIAGRRSEGSNRLLLLRPLLLPPAVADSSGHEGFALPRGALLRWWVLRSALASSLPLRM